MDFDFSRLDPEARYRVLTSTIVPRPIAWITTVSTEGVRNAAPFSFFNAMGKDPPLLAIGIQDDNGRVKDTARNIVATGEFVVNLVSEDLARDMVATSASAPADVDELTVQKIATIPSKVVAPERIAASPVAFECRLHTPLQFPSGQLIAIGEVLWVSIADRVIVDGTRPTLDTDKLELIGRLAGRDGYARLTDVFSLPRPD